MRALAMLKPPFHARARAAIAPPGTVTIARDPGEFIHAVARNIADVAIVDPTLVAHDRRMADSLVRAHLGTVLYIQLTPEQAQASVKMIRQVGYAEIVTYGYNDSPTLFAAALQRQSRAAHGHFLLRALAPQIANLPANVQHGVNHIGDQGDRIDSVERLASVCGVGRNTLWRNFKNAGINSAHGFVTGVRLLRNYDLLINDDLTILDIARSVGVSSERALNHQILAVAGLPLAEILSPIPIEQLAARIAGVLTAA